MFRFESVAIAEKQESRPILKQNIYEKCKKINQKEIKGSNRRCSRRMSFHVSVL